MTVKRFTCEIDEEKGHLVDVWYDNGKPIYTASKVCEVLNNLHDENIILKKEIVRWKYCYGESLESQLKIYEDFLESRGYDLTDIVTGLYDCKKVGDRK